MPLKEFQCRDCGNCFDFLILSDEDYSELSCSKCGSKNLDQQLSVFGFSGAVERPVATGGGGGGCSSCGSGSCSTCGH